ncbi:MAG: hypothetical protein FWF97_04140 [Alphaproteobacteria bacterium]|nr:hypothetical protein [Alphaproteobacteria bacterium]
MREQERIRLDDKLLRHWIFLYESAPPNKGIVGILGPKNNPSRNAIGFSYNSLIKDSVFLAENYSIYPDVLTFNSIIRFINMFGYVYDKNGKRALLKGGYDIIKQFIKHWEKEYSYKFEKPLKPYKSFVDKGFDWESETYLPNNNTKFKLAANAVNLLDMMQMSNNYPTKGNIHAK